MSILIKNAHILGDPTGVRKNILVEGDRILSVSSEEVAPTPADTVLDASEKTVMPGLVNAHTHAYMSLFRNYADDVPFSTWLFEKILPIEDTLTDEDAYWGDLLNFAEMIRTGTTTFIDQQMFPKSLVRAAHESGIRAVIARGLVGEKRTEDGVQIRWQQQLDAMEYAKSIDSNAIFMVAPHAIYTCSEDVLRYTAELSEEYNLRMTTHNAETKQEYDDCLAQHGMTPTAYLRHTGLLDRDIVLAHCVRLSGEDYALLARPNVYVATNPASNAKLANGIAPAVRMIREGIQLCLGTDGASSDNTQNMFTAMHLLSLLQKAAAEDAVVLSAKETLTAATKTGYRAIGMGEELGEIAPGKKADFILIDETMPNMLPSFDISSALVYSATGYEVTDSIIDGRLVMKDRELLTIDEERLRHEIHRITARF